MKCLLTFVVLFALVACGKNGDIESYECQVTSPQGDTSTGICTLQSLSPDKVAFTFTETNTGIRLTKDFQKGQSNVAGVRDEGGGRYSVVIDRQPWLVGFSSNPKSLQGGLSVREQPLIAGAIFSFAVKEIATLAVCAASSALICRYSSVSEWNYGSTCKTTCK